MTPEQKLAALFAADAPPARDYAFQARIAERIAARRAWMTVMALVPWAIAAAAVLWGLSPIVAPLAESLEATIEPSALVLAVASAAAIAALWLSRRFSAA
ncbi:hypothetical protein [Brevundimonas lenta]|uniref:Uncharacterized protein n=1 Tax=Brevundimonas lenta TaxID=424796 RepID=A0A7W6JDL3_9CAUL|nr:hypothetical protein [Brevundimonas lenta]MBB4083151.1 hypothetical protein [Brevundimonas lenta]